MGTIYQYDPAITHTLDEFIALRDNDQKTYRNFSILEIHNGIEFIDHNLLDDYDDIIDQIAIICELSDDEMRKYKYAPDLLAYDVYGSVQLDYFILRINGMVDPKEFDRKKIKLPYASVMNEFLSEILSANNAYIKHNRNTQNIVD